tara:strand:- start:7081 stop:7332 length:252 start_codon:yes stop_codon:yes gene_type:complete
MIKLQDIIETYINGNITIAKAEIRFWSINKMQIINCTELFGIRKTIKILKSLNVSDMHITNAFHDYDRQNIDEAKTILLNNFY